MFAPPDPEETLDKYDEERIHWEFLMKRSIIELDIPMRIALPLDDVRIRRIGDLISKTREELLKINRLGEKSVNELERILGRFDLYLGTKIEKGCPHRQP